MFLLHALMLACRFIVAHPCFIVCGNLLQERLSFMIPLKKLHAYFHADCMKTDNSFLNVTTSSMKHITTGLEETNLHFDLVC